MANTPKIAAAVGTAVGHGRAKAVGRTGRMIFSPGDTYKASVARMEQRAVRHDNVVADLKLLLDVYKDEPGSHVAQGHCGLCACQKSHQYIYITPLRPPT